MKKYAFALLFCLVLSCGCSEASASGAKAVTPPVGSALRHAILAPLRSYLRENLQVEAVFVVRWLKVKDGWAWIETDPQSKDGKARYEPFHALLKREDATWAIVEIPPMEEDSPPIDGAYFRKLMETNPGLPPEVFPWEK
jgi:hypothetical protein